VRVRADGEVEFIGRVDHQIKLRGHRVEPAEIEAVVAAHPDVAEAIVLAREDHAGKRLVAYVAPAEGKELDSGLVRAFTAERLPEVLVPAAVVVLDSVPLTGTGKVDRNALAEMELPALPTSRKPETPDEDLLCRLLAEVLAVREIGAEDDFFAMGGDSISAIQLAARARGVGLAISPRDVFIRRTAARIAAVAQTRADEPGRSVPAVGPMPLTPAACRLVALGGRLAGHAEPRVVRVPAEITEDHLVRAAQSLLDHHDALRMRLSADDEGNSRMEILTPGTVQARDLVQRVDVTGAHERRLAEVIVEQARAARGRLDPGTATMGQLIWLDAGGKPGHLLVVLHHLVADDESWPMLLLDLVTACHAATTGGPVRLECPVTSLRGWTRGLEAAASEPSRVGEFRFWREGVSVPDPVLGIRRLDSQLDVAGSARSFCSVVGTDLAGPLLSSVPVTYRADAEDVLLTGLALAVAGWRESRGVRAPAVRVMLDGNGRAEQAGGVDLSRTVGRLTSPVPISLNPGPVTWDDVISARPAVGMALKRVKDQLRAIPGAGLGYGLLRYRNAETGSVLASQPEPQLRFRYVSRLGPAGEAEAGDWSLDRELTALASGADADLPLAHALDVEVLAENLPDGPVLSSTLTWAGELLSEEDVRELAGYWQHALEALARHAENPAASRLSPVDVPLVSVTQDEIDSIEDELSSADGMQA
jgi:non-ribosomal peptide synthase protein (TIGR01720 family)